MTVASFPRGGIRRASITLTALAVLLAGVACRPDLANVGPPEPVDHIDRYSLREVLGQAPPAVILEDSELGQSLIVTSAVLELGLEKVFGLEVQYRWVEDLTGRVVQQDVALFSGTYLRSGAEIFFTTTMQNTPFDAPTTAIYEVSRIRGEIFGHQALFNRIPK
jgi:hypothetical protein